MAAGYVYATGEAAATTVYTTGAAGAAAINSKIDENETLAGLKNHAAIGATQAHHFVTNLFGWGAAAAAPKAAAA